jgi:energy-coupling factor transport system ATP-binding protein
MKNNSKSKTIVEVKNLTFVYPAGVTALRNVNLKINKGEIIAIVGQNGSGKTTLVKHFNGLLLPTRGNVIVNGCDTRNFSTAKLSKSIGYVFQNPDDQIFMNKVYDEVSFGPKNLNLKKEEVRKRVKDALDFVGLWELRNTHPLDLNLDDKKLLAIASIVSMNPDVIILDEPTSGQDHYGIKKVESLIRELSKNHTVIIISHDMDLVSRVATHIVVMFDSRVIFEGNPRDVFLKTGLLAKTHLKPPLITQLSREIKGLRSNILTINEFVEELEKKVNKSRSSKSR